MTDKVYCSYCRYYEHYCDRDNIYFHWCHHPTNKIKVSDPVKEEVKFAENPNKKNKDNSCECFDGLWNGSRPFISRQFKEDVGPFLCGGMVLVAAAIIFSIMLLIKG